MTGMYGLLTTVVLLNSVSSVPVMQIAMPMVLEEEDFTY